MKPIFFVIVCVAIVSTYSCSKQTINPKSIEINQAIAIRNCANFTAAESNYSICFDTVTTESRCPINAICIWEGYATAKFTITSSLTNRTFSLSTLMSNKSIALQNDTTINGIKIELTNLAPYPGEIIYNHPPYIATLKITQ